MIRYVHSCGSTQDWAKSCGEEGIYVCGSQTKGRGKNGRIWVSPLGLGLYMTILKFTDYPIKKLANLPITVAKKVKEWMAEKDVLAEIKEPNDLVVNGKKISGILVEKRGKRLLIGIGINLNYSKEELPYFLREKATSLFIEKGQRLNPLNTVPEILWHLEDIKLY